MIRFNTEAEASPSKEEIVKKLDNEKLLGAFESYSSMYDPLNENKCAMYEALKAECLRRMGE